MPLTIDSWFEEHIEEIAARLPVEARLKGIKPEDRLLGLTPEDIQNLLKKYSQE